MSPLFEYLTNKGLLKGNKVNESVIAHLQRSAFPEIAEEATSLTSAQDVSRESSIFSHSASLSLGGGRFPCCSMSCRRERIAQLLQFAAFYSDRVYMKNFLEDYLRSDEYDTAVEDLRADLYDDLRILLDIYPFIQKGIIIPVTTPEFSSPDKLAVQSFGENADMRLREQLKSLVSRMVLETTIQVQKKKTHLCVEVQGPEELIEHGSVFHHTKALPPTIRRIPSIVKRLDRGEIVTLTMSQRAHSSEVTYLAREILGNIVFDMAISQSLHASFLTERQLHVKILNSLSNDQALLNQNSILERHLKAIVPYIEGVSPRELLRLREKEGDSFLLFRNGLSVALGEAIAKKGQLTERDARELFSDIVAPKLARLDNKVKSARRNLLKGVSSKIGAWVGAITIGSYIGFLPNDIIHIARTLGLTKVAADILEAASQLRGRDEEIRQEDFYFLWRVREISRR